MDKFRDAVGSLVDAVDGWTSGSCQDPVELFGKMWSIDLQRRRQEIERICTKHPDRVALYVASPDAPFRTEDGRVLDARKFMVPDSFTLGQFLMALRMRHLHSDEITPSHGLFLFLWSPHTNSFEIPSPAETMRVVHSRGSDVDGILYALLRKEATFG